MSNAASTQLLQIVNDIKESGSLAEREFYNKSTDLQISTLDEIDLFDGTAVAKVADIASESKKICDSLYASLQTLVVMLDAQCRPLLDQNPEFTAVREVYNLIKHLNDESEIKNDFTASLNGTSLGGVASTRYIPSIENKAIQSFWETKCNSWPGRAETLAAEALQREEEQRLEKARLEKKGENFEKEYALWKQKADEIDKLCETEVKKAKEKRIKEIEDTHTTDVKKIDDQKAALQKQIDAAEDALYSLGFFKFAEKKAAKGTIEELATKISAKEAEKGEADKLYQEQKDSIATWVANEKKQILKKLKKEHNLPPMPLKNISNPNITIIANEILNGMSKEVLYTVQDLKETNPALSEYSDQQISAILRQLTGEYVETTIDKRKKFFYLI